MGIDDLACSFSQLASYSLGHPGPYNDELLFFELHSFYRHTLIFGIGIDGAIILDYRVVCSELVICWSGNSRGRQGKKPGGLWPIASDDALLASAPKPPPVRQSILRKPPCFHAVRLAMGAPSPASDPEDIMPCT